MYLYAPGFQMQVFKHVKKLSERLKKKKNKGSIFIAASAYKSQNAQFGLEMVLDQKMLLDLGFSVAKL